MEYSKTLSSYTRPQDVCSGDMINIELSMPMKNPREQLDEPWVEYVEKDPSPCFSCSLKAWASSDTSRDYHEAHNMMDVD